ncbi:MAG: pyridoxamine 5'-phosphate oxidase family protein [Bdellovibrio sp.]|nr:pyridoxamine 5'-phosphate oxidase family protein [Bdellovibrio sp.]
MKSELESEIRNFFSTPHRATAYLATVDSMNGFMPEIRPITLIELDWFFYFATTTQSRKATELARHENISALVMFKNDTFSGYLRIAGTIEQVYDVMERERIADVAAFRKVLECRWKGAKDSNLSFIRIIPQRIEYMRPGEDDAKDVTADLLPIRGGNP